MLLESIENYQNSVRASVGGSIVCSCPASVLSCDVIKSQLATQDALKSRKQNKQIHVNEFNHTNNYNHQLETICKEIIACNF